MRILVTVLVTLFLGIASFNAFAASTKEEVKTLQGQVEQLQKDIDEIKKLLQEGARAPAPAARQNAAFSEQTVSIGNSPVMGDMDAPVTIIEYSDYQCPFCARSHRDVFPIIKEEYIDTGKVRFIMRENPLTSIHRNAFDASMAALCAADQDNYWEMADLLFANQRTLTTDNLKGFATQLELDSEAFNECLDTRKYENQVQADLASGAKLGMRGTPGFFIGTTDAEDPDKANLEVFIRGAQAIDQFRGSINDLLE